MGTMRYNFAGAFVLLILMLSTSQSLPWTGQNSPRNSLAGTLTSRIRATSSKSKDMTQKCLFVDPKLPICDEEWLSNYEDEKDSITSTQGKKDEDKKLRSRRNVNFPGSRHVTIYTFEGCVPERIPFLMPSCEDMYLNGNLLEDQLNVEVLRPFAVKGIVKPPFEFPKFDYGRWFRMMTRFHHRTLSERNNEESSVAGSTNVPSTEASHVLTAELMNAATTKETMPNAMAASMNVSKGSSSNKLILPSQTKPVKSSNKEKEIILSEVERMEQNESSSSLTIENVSNDQGAESRRRSKAKNLYVKKARGRSKVKGFDKETVSLEKLAVRGARKSANSGRNFRNSSNPVRWKGDADVECRESKFLPLADCRRSFETPWESWQFQRSSRTII